MVQNAKRKLRVEFQTRNALARGACQLESELLHEQVHVVVDLEPVEVVGVSLQLHEQPPVGDVGGQAARRLVSGAAAAATAAAATAAARGDVVALDPVDLPAHDVLEGVRAGAGAAVCRVPLAWDEFYTHTHVGLKLKEKNLDGVVLLCQWYLCLEVRLP